MVKFESKFSDFYPKETISEMSSAKWGPFCLGLIVLIFLKNNSSLKGLSRTPHVRHIILVLTHAVAAYAIYQDADFLDSLGNLSMLRIVLKRIRWKSIEW